MTSFLSSDTICNVQYARSRPIGIRALLSRGPSPRKSLRKRGQIAERQGRHCDLLEAPQESRAERKLAIRVGRGSPRFGPTPSSSTAASGRGLGRQRLCFQRGLGVGTLTSTGWVACLQRRCTRGGAHQETVWSKSACQNTSLRGAKRSRSVASATCASVRAPPRRLFAIYHVSLPLCAQHVAFERLALPLAIWLKSP